MKTNKLVKYQIWKVAKIYDGIRDQCFSIFKFNAGGDPELENYIFEELIRKLPKRQ